MTTIYAYIKRENQHSGARTVALTPEAEKAARAYVGAKHGKTLEQVARRGRVNSDREFTFTCGGGYAVKDDLLGGDGSGDATSDFESAYGYLAIYKSKRAMNAAMREAINEEN